MRVVVDTSARTTRIDDLDVYTALDVLAVGTGDGSIESLDELLRRNELGVFDGQHAHLAIDALRAAATSATDFDAMIEYARGKGWVQAETATVRAHVVRVDPSA